MSAENPPTYNFPGIQFNPSFFDNENNISQYEADNTYLKKPINQNTGLLNSVLTLTNTGTPKESSWTTPAVAITNYVNYDSGTSSLISNVSGTPTTITSINTTGTLQSRGLTIKNASNVDVSTISIAGAITGTSLSAGTGTISTSGAINGGAITGTSLSGGTGLISTTGSLQSRGLTVKNTSNVDVATISNLGALVCTSIQNNNNTLNCGNITSGSINSGAINANANLIETTGNLQSRGLTIKSISNTNVCTISNVGNINITGAYSGADYIYTSNGDIQTALGDIYTNNGELRSRGLKIKNASDVDVSTISIAGAITGTSLSAGTGTISTSGAINGGAITGTSLSGGTGTISTSGAINGGAITGTSLSGGTGLISTTGSLQSRGLVIQDATPTNRASISTEGAIVGSSLNVLGTISTFGAINGGAITGTSLSGGTGTISTSGAINGGAITGTSLSGGTGTISTSGAINGGAITGTSLSGGTGTISTSGAINGGAITGTSLSGGTGLISTTGNLQSRGLTIKNASNVDVSTISIAGAIIGTSLGLGLGNVNCGGVVSFSIDTGQITAGAITSASPTTNLDIGLSQTTGNINIGTNSTRTTGNIYIGESTTTTSSLIINCPTQINKPININYPYETVFGISSFTAFGGHNTFTVPPQVALNSTTLAKSLTGYSIIKGIYIVSYCLNFTVATGSSTFTRFAHGLSTEQDVFDTTDTNISRINIISTVSRLIPLSNPVGSITYTESNCGIIFVPSSTSTIYLTYSLVRTGTGTPSISCSHFTVVRIG